MLLRFFLQPKLSGVDGGEHFFAMGTQEAIASFAAFGRRAIIAEGSDGDGHGQVVTEMMKQFFGNLGTQVVK